MEKQILSDAANAVDDSEQCHPPWVSLPTRQSTSSEQSKFDRQSLAHDSANNNALLVLSPSELVVREQDIINFKMNLKSNGDMV